MKLKCQCCGFEEDFVDGEAAFQAGWDAPPHFITGFVCCPLCPAVCVVLGKGHRKAHALWERIGRPKDWDVAYCGVDDDMPDIRLH